MRRGREQQNNEDARNMRGSKVAGEGLHLQAESMQDIACGRHDMVRRVDPNGEALVWCRKYSGMRGAVWGRS